MAVSRNKVIRASAVNVGSNMVLKVLTLGQNILFARIFLPDQIGTLAAALLVLQFFSMFTKMGFNESVVRDREAPEKVLDTALTLSLSIGLGLMTIIFVTAPWVARLMHVPEGTVDVAAVLAERTTVIRVLSVMVLQFTLELPNAMWIRRYNFAAARVGHVVDVLIATSLAMLLYFQFELGAWALFYGKLGGFAAKVLAIWIIAPHRPKLGIDRAVAKKLYSFGWPLIVAALGNYLIWEGDDWLVGAFHGTEQLAFYVVAFAFPFYIKGFADVLISSLLPTYSELQDSSERVAVAFEEANRYLSIMLVPVTFGLFALAEPFIQLVYGEKWIPAILPLKLFAIGFTIEITAGYSWGILALARGKTKYLMYMRLWITSYLMTVGAWLIWTYGIVGGALYTLTQAVLTVCLVRPWILYRELGRMKYLRQSVPPVLAALGAGLPTALWVAPEVDNLGLLAAAAAGYGLLYAVIYVVLDRSIVRDSRKILGALLGRKS
ncbi:hypothetical protein ABI59_18895 [Acidobacteria bacterium Mor1]|nr:hypothetical protein ABI59_18895 [Acidobacteria bacterium Mor1]